MPRPKTKDELIFVGNENFKKLFDLINSMTDEEQNKTFSFEDRDKNIRDVLIHLYEWHQLLINWIISNQSGEDVPFLPEPYNWKTYPDMNIKIWEKHQNTSYSKAIADLKQSHAETMRLIETFTDKELFTKKHFTWTGATNVGSYCVSATSSHYDWAMKKIMKHKKSL
jgi:hypothetical protein